jgi:DNA-directed RNA polymerase subunit RPC12/RpoP
MEFFVICPYCKSEIGLTENEAKRPTGFCLECSKTFQLKKGDLFNE